MTGGWDPTWEKVFRTQAWGSYPPEHIIRLVARAFYSQRRETVRFLDLGCGPGACTWFLARERFRVAGIDGSATAIELAKKRLAGERLEADLRVGDYVSLPWGNATFDGVVDNASIYCNPFPVARRVVDEVRRVMKPGGRFFSCNFTRSTWGYGLGREVEPGGFVDISDGPLAGKGFSLFMDRDQVDALYAGFDAVSVEQIRWSLGEMKHWVELWVVSATKGA
jgi:SAM-dependent methyltransferase